MKLPTDDEPATLVQGDCREILPRLASADVRWVVVVDPPYGIDLTNHSEEKTWNGQPRVRKQDWSIANDGGLEVAKYVCDWSEDENTPLVSFTSPDKPLPGKWRNILVWDKGKAVGAGGDPTRCWKRSFEMIYVARNGELNGGRDSSVLHFPVNTGPDFEHHPCQKPLPLLRYLIRKVSRPDDVILDPCTGSGSTLVAALMEGRKCVGIELDAKHFQTAQKRVRKRIGAYMLARGLFKEHVPGETDIFGHPLGD